MSVESLWQHCVKCGKASDGGTTLRAIADAVERTGQTLETLWPYNDTLGAGSEPTPRAAVAGTFKTAALFDVPLANDGIETDIETTLAIGLPVIVVIEMTTEFENPGPDGEINVPPLTTPAGDYHAVAIVGAATNAAGTARRFLIRNSWGAGWGAGGYGWLPYDYLVAFAGKAAAIDPQTLGTR